ncbi:hypothetical protein LTR86_006335 [Recurvomyces mirabilis]|nr:hypothetical protein LTR86_006335 [Recurvomyces mirabilis]
MATNNSRSGPLPGSLSATATAVRSPETPSKSGRNDVREYLNTFCRQFDITLPLDETASPSTRANTARHALLNKVRPLYWRQKEALDLAVVELLARRPQVKHLPDRLDILNARLAEAMTTFPGTPRTRRTSPNKLKIYANAPAFDAGSENDEPKSPTLAVKHAPPASAAIDIDIPPLGEALPRPIRSAATSFDSATAMTRSFMTSSTDLSRTSTNTAATSIYDETSATQHTDYMQSSLGLPDEQVPVTPETQKKKIQRYQLRDMPTHGLGQVVMPEKLLRLAMDLRYEAYRIMSRFDHTGVSLETKLLPYLSTDVRLNHLHEVVDELDTNGTFVRGRRTDFSNATLSACLHSNKTKDMNPFFRFELKVPQVAGTTSYQREYGGHRILTVDLADFKKPPTGYDREAVKDQFLQLISKPQVILGITWEIFLVQDKKRKRGNATNGDDLGNLQAHFFAVTGPGIPYVSIQEFLQWFLPYRENSGQSVCKAYTRLDLGASRSTPTIVFEPKQIVYLAADKTATKDLEPNTFMDGPDPHATRFEAHVVMSDGASSIAEDLMEEIRNQLGLKETPAAVQARFCGSKGLWVCDPRLAKGTIQINKSQSKVKHTLDTTTSRELLTFNVINWSRPTGSSFLYSSFIPILMDRGVPADVLLAFAKRATETDTAKFLDALQDPIQLHRWVHEERGLAAQRSASNRVWELADFPTQPDERICRMLESGFDPLRCDFLAMQTHKLGRNVFSAKAKRFKIQLNASTLLMGIPDPYEVLEPGQVHMSFSTPIKDEISGKVWSRVLGQLLVARHPGMGPWDVQKLEAVDHHASSHLHDVIVFSTKGPRPAAGKLSGGDYDGDMFWTTWVPELTEPFWNAPAPWDLPTPSDLGIIQDTRTIHDLAGTEAHRKGAWTEQAARAFIRNGIGHRMKWSALGEITNKHSAVTHKDGTLSSPKALTLVALHDVYIDADKQGYDFPREVWQGFQRKHGLLDRDYPSPPYREYMHKDTSEEAMSELATRHASPKNILDRICFEVAQPIVDAALAKAKRLTQAAVSPDTDLAARSNMMLGEEDGSYIRQAAQALLEQLKDVNTAWNDGMARYNQKDAKLGVWQETVSTCRDIFTAIKPADPQHPTATKWLRTYGHTPSPWDLLKASALAGTYAKNQGKMMFTVAGSELCLLKVESMGTYRSMSLAFYMQSKPVAHRTRANMLRADQTYFDDVDDEFEEAMLNATGSSEEHVHKSVPCPPGGRKRASSSGPANRETVPKRHQPELRTPMSAPQNRTYQMKLVRGPRRATTTGDNSTGQDMEAKTTNDGDDCGFMFSSPPEGIGLPKGQHPQTHRSDL